MIKAVVDTNLLVSGLISPRAAPARIIDSWHKRKFILITSGEILKELQRVLTYPKIAKKYHLDKRKVEEYLRGFSAFAKICLPTKRLTVIKDDPEDNKFIEVALFSGADFIVSGNHHLLDLGEYRGIKILTASQFLKELGKVES